MNDSKVEETQKGYFDGIRETLSKQWKKIRSVKASTWQDVAIFSGLTFIVYNYSDEIAGTVDNLIPNEEKMVEMMKEAEAQMMREAEAAQAAQAAAMMGGPPPGMR